MKDLYDYLNNKKLTLRKILNDIWIAIIFLYESKVCILGT